MIPLSLRVALHLDGDRTPALVYGELDGSPTAAVEPLLLPAGDDGWLTVAVRPGRYRLVVTLPSGRRTTKSIEVGSEPLRVEMSVPAAAHEHLAWPHLLGSFRSDLSRRALETRRQLRDAVRAPRRSHVTEAARRGRVACILYGVRTSTDETDVVPLESGRAVRLALPDVEAVDYEVHVGADEENVVVRFAPAEPSPGTPVLRGRPAILLDGVPGTGPLLASLPLPWRPMSGPAGLPCRLDVVVHQPLEGLGADRPELAVVLRDAVMGPLLGYLRSGHTVAVQAMIERFVPDVAELVAIQGGNPIAAVTGAYARFLMANRTGSPAWPPPPTERFPWLPDCAVLEGWSRVTATGGTHAPDEPDLAAARRLFLAAERNRPLLITGALRLLDEGLERCLRAAEAMGRRDDEVHAALARLRALARDSEPGQPFAVFRRSTL
jgi:hypothetical protein